MRIIKIEMENLNSLKGYWSIDFTNPDYETFHNLFVISGDTGSGKTTILDAITLALYGRTPRQKKVTKSENEIMTRHTGFCRAKITYKCKAGKFESEFYQQKSNKNSSGKLQNPECRIKNLDSGTEITEIAVTNLEKETAKIIQLDYDQFSRSIMLAQGEFDTFIMGDERSRAAILSKLNGTEHYKEIGARICEKASEYEVAFKNVEKEKSSIELLSSEKLAELESEKEKLNDENQKIADSLENVLNSLTWLDEIEECKKAVLKSDEDRKKFETEKEDFKSDLEKLFKAEKAAKCKTEYFALKNVEENIASKINENESFQKSLNECTQNLFTAKEEYESLEKSVSNAKIEFEKNSNIWKKIRKLDAQLNPLKNAKESAEKEKKSAEKKLSDENENLILLEKEIVSLDKNLDLCKKYLTENQKDAELESLNIRLAERKIQIEEKSCTLNKKNGQKIELQTKIDELELEKNAACEKLESLNSELKNLVSTEFLAISILLKNQLVEGKPCPVCGSLEHPFCSDSIEKNKNVSIDSNVQKVAVDVARLNEKIDSAQKDFQEIERKISSNKDEIGRIENEIRTLFAEISSEISKINESVKFWKNQIKTELKIDEEGKSNFDSIIETLKEISRKYQNTKTEKEKNEAEKKNKEIQKNAIKILDLQVNVEAAIRKFADCETEFNKVNDERIRKFGEKNPDEEEKNARNAIVLLEEKSFEKLNEKNDLEKSESNIKNSIENNKKDIKKFEEQKNLHLKQFTDVLEKNGFSSEKDFISCVMEDSEIEELKKKEELLTKRDGETSNAKKTADKNLEKKLKERKTSKEKFALEKEKADFQNLQSKNNVRIGEISQTIQTNNFQKAKAIEILKRYDEAKEKHLLWQEMKNFIGKKDGSDFEVFVESLAFKQLLKIANKYVEAITKKYTLVQVENSVDFLVHDSTYSDKKDDRPVSNMSGGEKFIISLSLALGISELASKNVRVDSLFLDEGFGTLSGEPLQEAIEALKSLQSSGKMLGIITHIESVINEFSLRIEAKKGLLGTSELSGPGVSRKLN